MQMPARLLQSQAQAPVGTLTARLPPTPRCSPLVLCSLHSTGSIFTLALLPGAQQAAFRCLASTGCYAMFHVVMQRLCLSHVANPLAHVRVLFSVAHLACHVKEMCGGAQGQGFRSVYVPRRGGSLQFAELLDRVAGVDPEMRVRFTSPHPKDFSDAVLEV